MLRSIGLMTFLTLVWGMNWSVMKIGATELPPLWFRGLGLIIGTVLLGIVLAIRGVSFAVPRRSVVRLVGLAFPNIIIWYSVATIAITLLPAGRAAILGYTMPAWTALIGAVVFREKLDGPTKLGVACALAGIVLLLGGDLEALVGHPLGACLMLGAAACWAWGTHLLKRLPIPIDTLAMTFWMMAIACPVVFAESALLEWGRWEVPEGAAWWPILYNAVLVLAIGNFIWFSVARTLPPVAAGLSSMMIPVVGVFSGIAMLGEHPGWRDFVALALITVAVGAGLIPKRRVNVGAAS